MAEYKTPLNAAGIKAYNVPGLGEKLSSLLHISSAIVLPPNARTVVTSGITGYDSSMNLPTDLTEEVMNAFNSVEASLAAAGVKGGLQSVYKLTTYHTSLEDDAMEALSAAVEKFFGENRPAWAGVGVGSLYGGARIEIVAEAVLLE
ncbi:hypothetical protein OIDMADRAFT_62413 [Oidiodendron maius Zn]|uniref:Uncharacterized protein n=1 Tax=Oidiodendron maius (strain Zn) TaxID=913774 RepID=A0A0C3C1D6_OIDMZ|nr:hypothetical protein OIDMADRAFT_62413 [Oidiodendron maius Zn]